MDTRTRYEAVFEGSPRGIFCAGDTISGSLIVTTKVTKILQSVTLTFTCRGRITRTPSKSEDNENTLQSEKVHVLLESGQQTFVWAPGEYKFNFKEKLPKNTPATYYGKKGYIIHEIVVKLIDGGNKLGNVAKIPFVVLQSDEAFLQERSLFTQKPTKYVKNENICYCCYLLKKPFKIVVLSPSNVQTPGREFNLFVVIVSRAKEKLWRLELRLMKHITYHYKTSTDIEQEVIASTNVTEQSALLGEKFSIGLTIPSTQPTTFRGGKLISIRYYAKIILELDTLCDRPFEVDIPVTIGIGNVDFEKEIFPARFGRQISLKAPIVKIESVDNFQVLPEISDFHSYFNRRVYYPPSIDLCLSASTKTHLSKSSENVSVENRVLSRINSDPCLVLVHKSKSSDLSVSERRPQVRAIKNYHSPPWMQTKIDFLESVFPSRCQSKSEQGI